MRLRRSSLALIAALVLALVGAACGNGDSPSAQLVAEDDALEPDSQSTAAEDSTADVEPTPEPTVEKESEPDAELVAAITAEIDEWMASATVTPPGVAVAVLTGDGADIRIARGVSDISTVTALETDDYFRFASVTKPLTSVVVLQLVEEGLIDLDEPVSTYLGDWMTGFTLEGVDYGGTITVRQTLNHTDGFAEFAFDLGFYAETSERLDVAYEPGDILDWARERGPLFEPGTAYGYNTVGPIAAGLVIEAVTGNQAHDELRARVFEPLGLDHIFLAPKEAPPQSVVHAYVAGPLREVIAALPGVEPYLDQAEIDDDYFDVLATPQEALTSAGWTGGGLEAQAGDVAAVFRAMFDGTMLSEEAQAEMLEPTPFENYGLGISVAEAAGLTAYSHGGGTPGFRSHAVYVPELDLAIAISTNLIQVDPDVPVLADSLVALIADQS